MLRNNSYISVTIQQQVIYHVSIPVNIENLKSIYVQKPDYSLP